MNRFLLIRRLRGPAYLLLVGVMALLSQAGILGWGKSWPLFLILAGVLLLAERAALTFEGGSVPPPYSGGGYPGANPAGAPYPGSPYAAGPAPDVAAAVQPQEAAGTAMVPAVPQGMVKSSEGGQS
jgi:hypothetical protein